MNQLAFELGEQYLGSGHFLTNSTGVGTLVSVIYSNAVTIAGVILIFLLIYAGSRIQSNWENPEALKEGNKIITYSLLGFVIIIASWFLIRILESSLGISILD